MFTLTLGSCFPFPVRNKVGGYWWKDCCVSERLDPDLLLSVSSLFAGKPALCDYDRKWVEH